MAPILARCESTGHPGGIARIACMAAVLWVGVIVIGQTAHATDSHVPWECSNYNGDAQVRCMQALIEVQREQLGKLQGQLNAQQGAMGQLKDQVERQAATTADLQHQLSQSPAVVQPVPPLYSYPPAGVGLYPGINLYLGRHWGFGYRPYLGYGPYWGGYPYPYFGHCRRHWRGCW